MPQAQPLQKSPVKSKTAVNVMDAHASAAICHEIAAQLHHDAAALHANGDHEQAGEYAKKAQDQGQSAIMIAAVCCQQYGNNNKQK